MRKILPDIIYSNELVVIRAIYIHNLWYLHRVYVNGIDQHAIIVPVIDRISPALTMLHAMNDTTDFRPLDGWIDVATANYSIINCYVRHVK